MDDVEWIYRSQHPNRELRYRLSLLLLDAHRTMTVAELVTAMTAVGAPMQTRPSKAVSDALRWEVHRGRAVRLTRGRYRTGHIPRSTVWWMRDHVRTATDRRSPAA